MYTQLKTPAQVCYHNDGWTLDLKQPAADKYLVEKKITDEIDTKADKVFQRIDREGISNLTGEDAATITWLCSSILMRGPISIELMKTTAQEKFTTLLAADSIPKELERLGRNAVEITHRHFPGLIENIGSIMVGSMSFNSKLIAKLASYQWMLCDFSRTNIGSIVISDLGLIISGTSLEADDSIIALPISPQKALFFTSSENIARLRGVGLGYLALATIDQAIGNAREFIIADENANENVLRRKMEARQ